MTKEDILDLFFSGSYENQLNEMILDDVEYVVDAYGVLNYVANVLDIPYSEFLGYISKHPSIKKISSNHITQSSSFTACEREMIDVFLGEDNRGLTFVEIGSKFSQYTRSKSDVAYRKYGENQVKTSAQLGLVFEYYKHWYLNCIGYIYNELPEDDKMSLLARNLLRDPLYSKIMHDVQLSDVDIVSYMDCVESNETKLRRYDSVKRLVDICIKECDKFGVEHYAILETKQRLESILKSKKNPTFSEEEACVPKVAEEQNTSVNYIAKFASLSCYQRNGKNAPYKALMLLSVINLIEKGIISTNKIYPSQELKDEYKRLSKLMEYDRGLFKPSFDNPFVYMKSEGFWHIKAKHFDYRNSYTNITKTSEIEYVLLDDELFYMISNRTKSDALKQTLILTYLHK